MKFYFTIIKLYSEYILFIHYCNGFNNPIVTLQTVSENVRLPLQSPSSEADDFDFWDNSGFMLRNDIEDGR